MLSIVLGELVPKSLALRSGEVVALAVARPLRVLASLFRPFVWFLTGASNLVLRPFRDSTTFTESRLSPEELRQLVEEAAAAGTLDARAGEIATRAIDLGGLRAAAVMVPRGKIVWLSAVASPEAVRATLRTKPHGRYPVRGASEDDILGYVVARDVYHQLLEGSFDLRRIVREVSFFPEGVSAVELLRALQEKAAPLGLLVDETGLVAGLVSPSDIADELVGEMVADGGGRAIVAERDGTYLVDAATPVHEVSRALGVELPTGPTFSTLAGLLITTAGTIPPPGAKLTLPGGVEAEVVDASRQRVRRARLRVPPPAPADSEPA
jgi:putative hemolysin